MTTTQLQLRRDTTANVEAITPAQGEPIYDVTRKALVLGDGATVGGNCVTPFSGAWAAQLQINGSAAGIVQATTVSWWMQSGPLVFAFFDITLSSKGSGAGNVTIVDSAAALPGMATVNIGAVQINYHANLATSPAFECDCGGAPLTVNVNKSGGTNAAAITNTDLTNTTRIAGLAIYPAAQPTG